MSAARKRVGERESERVRERESERVRERESERVRELQDKYYSMHIKKYIIYTTCTM